MKNDGFRYGDSFEDGLRRLATGYNSLASDYLQRQGRVHENIHQARLCFKRMRSMLRLLRSSMGTEIYHFENGFYRDMARSLSFARDITANYEAASGFISKRRSATTNLWIKKYMFDLQRKRASIMKEFDAQHVQATLIAQLAEGLQRSHLWNFSEEPSVIIYKGIFRSYTSGQQGYRQSQLTLNDHDFHEWRKDVKYLWYLLQPFVPLWPAVINDQISELKKLSTYLGAHHDLVLLENAIPVYEQHAAKMPMSLKRSINERKRKLSAMALQQGALFYAGSAKDFADRISRYWETWVKQF
ncbi:MAG: CHAD domain-containing protein [Bacteroidales bacterium]|nr:CHAD domain-containing protein [Bacteroidales bacterium]MDZ4204358.1 CHAD domain-containing protein [Bacteroidales bacterium]